MTVYSRSFSPWLMQESRRVPIELVQGELPAGDELDPLIARADIVFFLAGSSTPGLSDEDAVGSIIALLEPGLSVLDKMRRCGTERVVIASSGGTVYGNVEIVPTPETAETRPTSLHGLNSLALENYARFYASAHRLKPIVLRYSNVYGPGGRAKSGQGVIHAWCEALSREEPIPFIGDGSTRRDFIFVNDAAAATVRAALTATEPRTFNVGSGTSISLLELLNLIQEVTGREARLRDLPARPVDVPVTELDCTELSRRTGWAPATGLADGLAATWAWTQAVLGQPVVP